MGDECSVAIVVINSLMKMKTTLENLTVWGGWLGGYAVRHVALNLDNVA